VSLAWTKPADGGSPITGYRIYRATGTGSAALLTTVTGSATTYRDAGARRGTTYSYTVTATNAIGEGATSNSVTIVVR